MKISDGGPPLEHAFGPKRELGREKPDEIYCTALTDPGGSRLARAEVDGRKRAGIFSTTFAPVFPISLAKLASIV